MRQNHADWSVKFVEVELKLPVTAALALTLPAEPGQSMGRNPECGALVSGHARDVAEEGLFVSIERDDRVGSDDFLGFRAQGAGGIEREERLFGHVGEVAQDPALPRFRDVRPDRSVVDEERQLGDAEDGLVEHDHGCVRGAGTIVAGNVEGVAVVVVERELGRVCLF